MRAAPGARTPWQKFARRARVPLGFCVAAVFLISAAPTWRTLAAGLVPVALGLWLRAYAAGFVKKNAELTRTGPYAHTRNPLYLGSMLLAAGFAIATGRWPLVILLVGMFLAIYIPTIRSEEQFLRATFPAFDAYCRQVPRLWWRITAAKFPGENTGSGHFDPARYRHHREYNALGGSLAIYAALAFRMWLSHRH